CLSYGLISESFATRNNLQRINVAPRSLIGFNAPSSDRIHQAAILSMDIDGHREEQAFCYIVPRIASYDMILGLPWMKKQDVRLNAPQSICKIRSSDTLVRNQARTPDKSLECYSVSAAAFSWTVRRQKQQKKKGVEVFSASLADINKALAPRSKTDPRTKLPKHYHQFLAVFDPKEADKLPPVRGPGIDHAIEIEKKDGKEQRVPWGPLYNMSREELLVLRKML